MVRKSSYQIQHRVRDKVVHRVESETDSLVWTGIYVSVEMKSPFWIAWEKVEHIGAMRSLMDIAHSVERFITRHSGDRIGDQILRAVRGNIWKRVGSELRK